MSLQFGYAMEKLHVTEQTLATHPGRIKERLLAAVVDGFGRVFFEALPDDVRHSYDEIHSMLTSVEPKGTENRYVATIEQMNEAEATKIAWAILSLIDEAELEQEKMRT
jgi:hypothetical protein